MHDMNNVDVIILFPFILTQFIFSYLYAQHYYCVKVMALNYVNVFIALHTFDIRIYFTLFCYNVLCIYLIRNLNVCAVHYRYNV